MSAMGRWNGVFYFVPLVVIAGSRLELLSIVSSSLTTIARAIGYALVATTVVSIADRAVAPLHARKR